MDIKVLCHSSIKIKAKDKIIYIDPFKIQENLNDADIIAITHSHYDHFSKEDISKVKDKKTKILVTDDLYEEALNLGFDKENITVVKPNNLYNILDIKIQTIPAYNINKKFHPKTNNWVGYVMTLENKKVYIAGDTDITEESSNIKCDIALVPVGGTYTMTYKEAGELVNKIKPYVVIPTHYGDIVGEKQDGIKFQRLVNENIKVDIQL